MSGHSKTYAVDGLVLREQPYGENDCLFTLLTAEKGRITVIAKGARSLKSRVRGGIQPYTYGNYELADKNGPAWLRAVSVTESFPGLRAGIEPLALAAYIADVAYELSGEGVPAGELLQLVLNTLFLLANRIDPSDGKELLRVKAGFELRAMTISGYAPDLSACETCGCAENDAWYLDVMNGALICSECFRKNAALRLPIPDPHETGSASILLPLDGTVLKAMRYVMDAPPKRIYSFTLPTADAALVLSRVTEGYLEHHLERTFESLSFFRSLGVGR